NTPCVRGPTTRRPGVRRTSSATGPPSWKMTSTSPRLSAAARVVSSGRPLKTTRLTLGDFRQYPSNASTTSSTPGLKDTNRYGPAPTGDFLNPSSPTCSTYFFGTIQPAADAVVPYMLMKSGHGALR